MVKIERLNETENFTRISRDEAIHACKRGIEISVTVNDCDPDLAITKFSMIEDSAISGMTLREKIAKFETVTLHNGSWLSYWIPTEKFMEAFA